MNKEILWNIINSALAGTLVLLGAMSNGHLTLESLGFAAIAGTIAMITQFKKYWETEEQEYTKKTLFSFVG